MVGRTFLGRYEAIRQLGEGGMGRVYLAKQVDLGRQVVVKVMHEQVAQDPKFRERFQCETLLMARFQHPYAVALYDASLNDPEGPCIVMEYIRGVSVDALLQHNTRLTPARAGRLLGQLCEALQAAHSQGIIHRDLKPANLMVVDPDTPYEKIKVMDFGLAKLIASRTAGLPKSDTGTDFAVGTPGYISPEQVRGEEVTYRSDLYSVGVILFEMLTGRLPFTGDETMDVLLAHATEPPPSFSAVGASWISPAVEAVVRSCLAKEPKERPASARELWQHYEAALKEQTVHDAAPDARESGQNGQPMNGKPKSAAEGTEAPAPEANGVAAVPTDPQAVVHRMEAWMPDAIAQYKLRGFVHDHGGQVLESAPGLIRVRLESKGGLRGGPLVWLGLSRKKHTLDMELRLERNNPQQQSQLHVTVILRSPDKKAVAHPAWRERCHQIFCDLRAYLAGASLE